MLTAALIFVIAVASGGLGALLGMGGGVFLVPALTLFLHLPVKTAIGASVVSVVAASCMSGAMAANTGMNHVRLALILELATTLGVLAGGFTVLIIAPPTLMFVFAAVILAMVALMSRRQADDVPAVETGLLDTAFVDPHSGQTIRYGVKHLPYGMSASFVAGSISGLLGIGGGLIKVPVMNLLMGAPLKAAIATSNFMVGITAAASAMIVYQAGLIHPDVAAPSALGVLLGARLATVWGIKSHQRTLRRILRVVLIFVAIQMLVKAWQS